MTEPYSPPPVGDGETHGRWPFIRDVLALQVKLLIGNLHNLILIPATMAAAALDLLFRSGRHGSRFYRVLDWGRRGEEAIGLYSALDRRDPASGRYFTVDAIVSRLEDAIVREVGKGGSAAGVKAAVDRALDRVHQTSDSGRERTRQAAQRVLDKLKRPAGGA
jgi:hypothetical protein